MSRLKLALDFAADCLGYVPRADLDAARRAQVVLARQAQEATEEAAETAERLAGQRDRLSADHAEAMCALEHARKEAAAERKRGDRLALDLLNLRAAAENYLRGFGDDALLVLRHAIDVAKKAAP